MNILGIETSCDETAASVVHCKGHETTIGAGTILSNVVLSQIEDHSPYGGVVPEIAARAHVAATDRVIDEAMAESGLGFADLDGVAATSGPGLIGGVLVGLTTAKAIAAVHDLPLMAINHLEAHALTARLTHGLVFPYLLLLVSGGHTQLLAVHGVGKYRRLGTTLDDALGEAFDKTAKLLSLGYPGGPEVEAAAREGDPLKFPLPRPLKGQAAPNFSFSGLKTAVARAAQSVVPISNDDVADICASFQAAASDVVKDRVACAMEIFEAELAPNLPRQLVIAGGVAANQAIGGALTTLAEERGYSIAIPPPALCTDNGAMIAWAGAERLTLGLIDELDAPARARWPLDPNAVPVSGAGVKA